MLSLLLQSFVSLVNELLRVHNHGKQRLIHYVVIDLKVPELKLYLSFSLSFKHNELQIFQVDIGELLSFGFVVVAGK